MYRRPFRIVVVAACFAATLLVVPTLAKEPVAKKIVLLAGRKSHGPGVHEYVKDLQFLKFCLDNATNVQGIKTELHLEGWPEDPTTLDDADTIVLFSDGCDHDEKNHPFLVGDRMKVIEKQMKRGCGLVVQHYATFCPERCREQYLDWVGGYFDYQNGPAANKWFSRIGWATSTLEPATPKHPTLNGVGPFEHKEEYYFNIRFRPNDPRLTPISTVTIPNVPDKQVVSWAVQRKDGGRGFATTCGHTHTDLVTKPEYRKLHLNAICWTAGIDLPAGGVETLLPGEKKAIVDNEKPIKALIVTGNHHPGHPWQSSTKAIKQILKADPRFVVDTIIDPDLMAKKDLKAYDVLVLNYCNWHTPSLSDSAGEALKNYIADGGGFAILHFANGAWGPGANPPLPMFDVWEEFAGKICRRIWIDGQSSHDAYGKFRVHITNDDHPITQGMEDFDTYDELYFNQQGEEPINVLATAHSKVGKKDAPMFFTYTYGKGRCFQNMLGHSIESITNPSTAALTLRGCAWAAGRKPINKTYLFPSSLDQRNAKKFGGFLDVTQKAATVPASEQFLSKPMTVECFAKLSTPAPFNVILSNDPKSSPTHWELYSFAGSGNLALYMPGCTPSSIQTGASIADNIWHYIAVTYDANNRVTLFVDGEKVAEANVQVNPANAARTPGPLAIGKAYDKGNIVPCMGQIDELRISNTVRTIDGVPQKPFEADDQTIGLWHFDENPGTPLLKDASSRKNDAGL